MGNRKRGFFQHDLGEHPPEIQKFLESWYRMTPKRGEGYERPSIGAPSSEEVRENARVFGTFLVLAAVIIPVFSWWWFGNRMSSIRLASLIVFGVCAAAFGVALLRSARGPRDNKRS